MRTSLVLSLLFALIITISSCKDQLPLENITLMLMVGIDLDKENNLILYSSSPVFNKEAKEKNEVTQVKSINLKDGRNKLEGLVSALISAGKIQNVLISRRVLEHEDWFKMMDVFYRDPKGSETARVAAVEGSIEEVIRFAPLDKRRMSLHIAKLIDTAHMRNLVQMTTLFDLHRQMYEKGITPYLSNLRKNGDIEATGTLFLNKKGVYAYTINHTENQLLQMLQNEKNSSLTLTVKIPEEKGEAIFDTGAISFYVLKLKRDIKVTFEQNKFHFDIQFSMPIHLTEKSFDIDVRHEAPKLEAEINQQLEAMLTTMVKKMQKHEIDPIGLGLYARGYQFKAWEKVQDEWGHAFSEADVHVHVRTKIKNMGETI
ncbi:Ger(x)C family spore germination protein [Paenibacillus roseipurpureus]|uniref:Ger(X)C family spore germination protein n=1 Tax=Paenibacillus roseopurpureus TaxID=2918901 RepID=A0AA96LTD7_9BACL|nr:Ger(x)C family spore germination protein [Paenibacillus sp. MBLB1832]WNR46966.1 Ger(x)C family spore germination protein [Paenibacillus sp. MBLB1832]